MESYWRYLYEIYSLWIVLFVWIIWVYVLFVCSHSLHSCLITWDTENRHENHKFHLRKINCDRIFVFAFFLYQFFFFVFIHTSFETCFEWLNNIHFRHAFDQHAFDQHAWNANGMQSCRWSQMLQKSIENTHRSISSSISWKFRFKIDCKSFPIPARIFLWHFSLHSFHII